MVPTKTAEPDFGPEKFSERFLFLQLPESDGLTPYVKNLLKSIRNKVSLQLYTIKKGR